MNNGATRKSFVVEKCVKGEWPVGTVDYTPLLTGCPVGIISYLQGAGTSRGTVKFEPVL